MVLTGLLSALIGVAFWLYCLIDLLLTRSDNCRYLPKLAWVLVVVLIVGFGAVAWLLIGRPRTAGPTWLAALRVPGRAPRNRGRATRAPGRVPPRGRVTRFRGSQPAGRTPWDTGLPPWAAGRVPAGSGWFSRFSVRRGRPRGRRSGAWHADYLADRMDDARSRHPAGRARPLGPDDDPAFLRHLDDLIHGSRDIGND